MEERKIVRIEIEYEDGAIERATGDDANEIWRRIIGMIVFQHIHGMEYDGPKLQPVSKP